MTLNRPSCDLWRSYRSYSRACAWTHKCASGFHPTDISVVIILYFTLWYALRFIAYITLLVIIYLSLIIRFEISSWCFRGFNGPPVLQREFLYAIIILNPTAVSTRVSDAPLWLYECVHIICSVVISLLLLLLLLFYLVKSCFTAVGHEPYNSYTAYNDNIIMSASSAGLFQKVVYTFTPLPPQRLG